MKDIISSFLRIVFLFFILFLVTRIFKRADENTILFPVESYYSKGNASDSTRIQILDQLRKFQDGYTRRDVNQVEPFMQSLYSRDNTLILGTMPREVFRGYDEASRLVKNDWEAWGDCKFMIDGAHISSYGNVAWFSTRGFVKFDLSSLLVMPLRLSGVMVNENGTWRFQQQQFQFDIDLIPALISVLILSAWILVSLIILAVKTAKLVRNRQIHRRS